MVNTIKECVKIEVYGPFLALRYLASRLVDSLVRVAVRLESAAMRVKVRLPDRGKHLHYGLLDETIHDRGYTQLAFTAIRFGYVNPFDGLWSIVTAQELAFDLGPVAYQVSDNSSTVMPSTPATPFLRLTCFSASIKFVLSNIFASNDSFSVGD